MSAEALEVAGSIAATVSVSAAVLAGDRRLRAAGMVLGLALALALIAGQGWDELESVRERPALLAGLCAAAAAALAGGGLLLRRWPLALPLLLVAALPFRIPIEVGGEDVNLLLPLYAVIGAGALALTIDALTTDREPPPRPPRALLVALCAATVLYAVQASHSSDIAFAARNVGFFLVPFAAMFVLLTEVRWTPRVLAVALAVVVAEAVLFTFVAVGQFAAQDIFWNPALELSNDFHFYFRANSLFWDPNIYGRYLALAAVLVTATLMWTRDPRRIGGMALLLAVVSVGLLLAFSQTSFLALLFGVGVLCALRYSLKWALVAAPFAVVAVAVAVIVVGGTSEAENDATEISSGRTTLVGGGVDLFESEPLVGHGSASFSEAFAEQEGIESRKTTVSHNEPVTVAPHHGVVRRHADHAQRRAGRRRPAGLPRPARRRDVDAAVRDAAAGAGIRGAARRGRRSVRGKPRGRAPGPAGPDRRLRRAGRAHHRLRRLPDRPADLGAAGRGRSLGIKRRLLRFASGAGLGVV
jgi:putative inorganic carbon (HCO3(-)) transporter